MMNTHCVRRVPSPLSMATTALTLVLTGCASDLAKVPFIAEDPCVSIECEERESKEDERRQQMIKEDKALPTHYHPVSRQRNTPSTYLPGTRGRYSPW